MRNCFPSLKQLVNYWCKPYLQRGTCTLFCTALPSSSPSKTHTWSLLRSNIKSVAIMTTQFPLFKGRGFFHVYSEICPWKLSFQLEVQDYMVWTDFLDNSWRKAKLRASHIHLQKKNWSQSKSHLNTSISQWGYSGRCPFNSSLRLPKSQWGSLEKQTLLHWLQRHLTQTVPEQRLFQKLSILEKSAWLYCFVVFAFW